MTRLRCALALLLGFGCQRLLGEMLPLGWYPEVLPPLVCLLALRLGPERGAEGGLLAGVLLGCGGRGWWELALLTLLGGLSGTLALTGPALWQRWLLCLPGLAGYALLSALLHGGQGAAFFLAGRGLLLSLACLPLAEGLCALCFRKKRRRRIKQGR